MIEPLFWRAMTGIDGVDEVERRLEVDRQHGIPLGLGHAHHQAVLGDSGVVHKDVDTAEILDDLVDDRVRLFEVGCVRGIALGLHAQRGDLGFGSFAVLVDRKVGERHVGALLGEFECDGLADAAGGAGHDGHFSFQ